MLTLPNYSISYITKYIPQYYSQYTDIFLFEIFLDHLKYNGVVDKGKDYIDV